MIHFGREITGEFASAARREWWVTNGLGGWAAGTVSGANTRRYHGVFVPALQAPLGRTVLVTKLEERLTLGDEGYALSANEYADGRIEPKGYEWIDSFELDGLIPTWVYGCAETRLEKRIWMEYGDNVVYVTYTVRRALRPLTLEVTPFVTARDAHGETRGTQGQPQVAVDVAALRIQTALATFSLTANTGHWQAELAWRWNIWHRVEAQRGLPAAEDHCAAGRLTATLQPGETLALIIALDGRAGRDWAAALQAERTRHQALLSQAQAGQHPAWVQQLVLAADQFIVQRDEGYTVIAGYPWFGDWGRDTMIALPGLALATRRYSEAAAILRTFARYVSDGMLPNRFPDVGERPEYNTVDATLWYFHAVEAYLVATGDQGLIQELFPVLESIVDWHVRGTRFGIQMDPADALLRAGAPGVQLTWMDVKIGEWVVTPRWGKPVEICALWINALRVMAAFCERWQLPARHPYAALAEQATRSFDKFWYAEGGYWYDVIEGPQGVDPTLRPNQLIALALPHGPLAGAVDRSRAQTAVRHCAARLLTPLGLRSVTPDHPAYGGRFAGDQKTRDAVYHQGTVWGWLMGPFVDAYRMAFRVSIAEARDWASAFEQHLADDGLGTIAEVFEGDAPFAPRGCVAQAWSVGEVLRLMTAT